MLFEHPVTKEQYTATEAAQLLGIPRSTFYNRNRKGETGLHLWRPSERVYFEHPITKKIHTAFEAAEMIGIHVTTLYNRRRHGDIGEHLWRPSEPQLFTSTLPSNRLGLEQDAILQKIPSETQYEKELSNGLRSNSEGFIHSDFNRI